MKNKVKTAHDIFDFAELEEYEYKAGQMESVVKACPKDKIIYTALDEDGVQILEVGLRFVNRFAIYFGKDLGLEYGSQYFYDSLEETGIRNGI